MEPQGSKRQIGKGHMSGDEEPPMHDSATGARRAPETLLANVMARVQHLDSIRDPACATPDLFDALRDSSWEVRAAAIQHLRTDTTADALEALFAALYDPHPAVRAAAIRALGPRTQLDQLILATQDGDVEVRQSAHSVLTVMSHEHDVQPAVVAHLKRHTTPLLALTGILRHFWLTLMGQARIYRREWAISALLLLISYGFTFFLSVHFVSWGMAHAGLALASVTTLASAFGVAFICERRHDAGLELELSTATSLRAILLSRYLLVTLSNGVVAALASTLMAVLLGQSIWSVTSLWIGPFLLVSSLTLTLALWLGSWLSFLAATLFAALQTVRLKPDGGLGLMAHSALWQTTPIMIAIAILLLVLAFMRMPRTGLPSRATT